MPEAEKQLVLVTGITGFVAVHVALAFLKHGYNVRGTVRTQAKAETVRELPAFAHYKEALDLVVMSDLTDGDFTGCGTLPTYSLQPIHWIS